MEVIVLTLRSIPRSVDRAPTLAELSDSRNFTFIEAVSRNSDALEGHVDSVNVVVHLASRAGVRPRIADPELYSAVNTAETAESVLCDPPGLGHCTSAMAIHRFTELSPVGSHSAVRRSTERGYMWVIDNTQGVAGIVSRSDDE